MRIPKINDEFLAKNLYRMFILLIAADNHPLGYPLNATLVKNIQDFMSEAIADGIDIIGVSEGCEDQSEFL
jgi:hypothetical protein